MHTFPNSEAPDEMPHNDKMIFREIKLCMEIIICDPLVITMDDTKFIVPSQNEESINILRINR